MPAARAPFRPRRSGPNSPTWTDTIVEASPRGATLNLSSGGDERLTVVGCRPLRRAIERPSI